MPCIDWHSLRYLKIFGVPWETILIVIGVIAFFAWLFKKDKPPKNENGGENR